MNNLEKAQLNYNRAQRRLRQARRNLNSQPKSNLLRMLSNEAENNLNNARNALKRARNSNNKRRSGLPEGKKLISDMFSMAYPGLRGTAERKLRFWIADFSESDRKMFLNGIRNPKTFLQSYPVCKK